jgi:hypothetical protein
VDSEVAEKKDVCYGMLTPWVDMLVPKEPATPVLPVIPGRPGRQDKEAVTKKSLSENERALLVQQMQTKVSGFGLFELDNYVSDMKYYWEQYEEIYFPNPSIINRGLGTNIKAISELMAPEAYRAYFTTAKMVVAQNRAAYMVESEQEPYLDQLKGMYMVEELLNWLIAQNQLTN